MFCTLKQLFSLFFESIDNLMIIAFLILLKRFSKCLNDRKKIVVSKNPEGI